MIQQLTTLFRQYFNEQPASVERLPQAGSDRVYFKLMSENYTAIGCLGSDIKENQTFIHHAQHFRRLHIHVPEIYAVSDDYTCYLQEYLGDESLYDLIKKEGISERVIFYFKKVLKNLAFLQIKGAENFDFSRCYPIQEFNRSSMFWDLNSFKYYFVRTAKVHFNETALNKDFHTLCNFLLEEPHRYFMFRDCQSRNVLIKNSEPYFIDFQGGRKGALQYDAASLIWQAGAKIPYKTREMLLDDYICEVEKLTTIDTVIFKEKYYGFVFIRMLQTLGTYGFRGLIEKRPHFLQSIVPQLKSMEWFLANIDLKIDIPELKNVLYQLIENEQFVEKKTVETAKKENALQIEINSFSFKRGIPEEKYGNGGGFVFDCRGILNPGRFEPYKNMTGKDIEVIDFLETKTKVKEFLDAVWKVISINIEDYAERNFEHLQINFGCTGGQHRSVYCAEQTAEFIREKFGIAAKIRHIERELNGEFI
jgi:aminoglycoside/choline kinase family phosphotransferase